MGSPLAAVALLTRRELVRFFREPSRIIASIGTPMLIWILLGSGFAGSFTGAAGDGSYASFLLPGMMAMTVLFGSIFAAISLIEDRHEGFAQSVLVSPAPRWSLIGAKVIGTSVLAGGQAAVLIPAVAIVGPMPSASGVVLALVVLLLIGAGMAGLGLGLAWVVDSTQGFHGIMNLVLLPMWILSGAVFPLSGAAGPMRIVMLVDPLTWPTEALRSALSGVPAGVPGGDAGAWAGAVAFVVIGVSIAVLGMGRDRAVA